MATPISSPSPTCCGRWRCRLEDGDASQAQRDLRAAEQKLREALQRGASDEEIAQADTGIARRRRALHARPRPAGAAARTTTPTPQLPQQDLEVDARPHGGHGAQRRARGRRGDARRNAEHVREHARRAPDAQEDPASRELRKQIERARASCCATSRRCATTPSARISAQQLGRDARQTGAPEAIRPIGRRSRSASARCATASPNCSGG